MLKSILRVLYKNSYIIRNKRIRHKDLFKNYLIQTYGNPTELTIEHKDKIFTFMQSEIDEENYILYSTDEFECVVILINKSDKVAEIHGIDNYETCVSTTLSNISVGSILLLNTINMLIKYKNKLNINKIMLVDNSLTKCNKINIEFSTMMILLTGHTWYGKYGFRPIDSFSYELDTINNNKYNNNINIMNTITITQANLLYYIKLTNKESLINDVTNLLNSNPDYLLSSFVASFLNNFDETLSFLQKKIRLLWKTTFPNETCKYFNMFYKELFYSIGLTNFRGQSFGLEL
jgi:hypothetical protein